MSFGTFMSIKFMGSEHSVLNSSSLEFPDHNPSRFSKKRNEDLALAKQLNLLTDDDPLLNIFPGSECTLDYVNDKQLQQNHPCVIEVIRRHFLHPPAQRDVPYYLSQPNNPDPSSGQGSLIRNKLKNQTNGFFIECGAYDGESLSNTLYMERFMNWTGVLIEADNGAFKNLLPLRRKAYALHVCLSLVPYPTKVLFNQLSQISRLEGTIVNASLSYKITKPDTKGEIHSSQCFPLYSILLAINRTQIDYFSFDVEGYEPAILRTIPWHKVDIKTLTLEWAWTSKNNLTEILLPLGYYVFEETVFDLLFAKNESQTDVKKTV